MPCAAQNRSRALWNQVDEPAMNSISTDQFELSNLINTETGRGARLLASKKQDDPNLRSCSAAFIDHVAKVISMTGAPQQTDHRPGIILGAVLVAFSAAAAYHWQSNLDSFVPFVEHYHGGDELDGAIFIGHLATDLDSIVAAIAAADLHRFRPAERRRAAGSILLREAHFGLPAASSWRP